MFAYALALILISQQKNGLIERDYDKFKDTMQFRMDVGYVFDNAKEDHQISAHIATLGCKGQEFEPLRSNDKLLLILTSSSKSWKFVNDHRVICMIDGDQRIDFGETLRDGRVVTKPTSFVIESLPVIISVADLEKMSLGRKVEFQVSRTEFALSKDQIAMLKTFWDRVNATDVNYQAILTLKEAVQRAENSSRFQAIYEAQKKQNKLDREAKEAQQELATKILAELSTAMNKAKETSELADPSVRARTLAKETERAKNDVCKKFKITRSELSKMINGK